jgi:hypothetical protein
VKNYYTVDEEIFGESEGAAFRNYVRDALGSVVAMTDSANAKLFTARYKPYGDTLASTGTAPSFTWVGVYGYLKAAGSVHNEFSVRARFYGSREGRWTAVDPLWPYERAYGYVAGRAVTYSGPSGTDVVFFPAGAGGSGPRSCCASVADTLKGNDLDALADAVAGCMAGLTPPYPGQKQLALDALKNAQSLCGSGGKRVCVFDKGAAQDKGCDPCRPGWGADAVLPLVPPSLKPPRGYCVVASDTRLSGPRNRTERKPLRLRHRLVRAHVQSANRLLLLGS